MWSNLRHLITLYSCSRNVTLKMAGLPPETCRWRHYNKNTSVDLSAVCCFLIHTVQTWARYMKHINTSNAELNPICHLLVLLGTHHIFHVSRVRVKRKKKQLAAAVRGNVFCIIKRTVSKLLAQNGLVGFSSVTTHYSLMFIGPCIILIVE